jgi:hypothetical protein
MASLPANKPIKNKRKDVAVWRGIRIDTQQQQQQAKKSKNKLFFFFRSFFYFLFLRL